MTANEANELAKSKIIFLDETLRQIKSQSERGLFVLQVSYHLINKKTIEKLEELGYKIERGGVDNSYFVIRWEDIANKIERREEEEEEAIRKAADSIKKDTELFFLSEKLVRSFSEEMPEGFTTKEILESMEKRKNLILDSFGVKATRVVAT